MPDNNAQLSAIAAFDQLLTARDVPYWLFGGWAVDFHAGRFTRAHADIDVAIWVDDRARVAALLREAGWSHTPEEGEDGYTCYQNGPVRLEVAFLARDDNGAVYTPTTDGRGEWPTDSFGDTVATLDGVRARVVSRQSLIADKSTPRSDAVTAEKDRADVASLLRSM